MAFGSAIRKLREDAGISVDKLADKIGVKAARWRKWEEKDFDPRDEDQAKIEAFFGMSLTEIGLLEDIKKFLKVPNRENPMAMPMTAQELTPGQIMSLLAKANDRYAETLSIQARILERIENKMALEETQGLMKANLIDIRQDVTKLVERQESAVVEIRDLFSQLGAQRKIPSKDAHKKAGQNDGN